jgi:hypothetical protein
MKMGPLGTSNSRFDSYEPWVGMHSQKIIYEIQKAWGLLLDFLFFPVLPTGRYFGRKRQK